MPENATHIFIHHYIDNASSLYFGMVCCIILIVVIVLLLMILLGVVIYIVVSSKKSRQSRKTSTPLKFTKRHRENPSSKNLLDTASPCNGITNPAAALQDSDTDVSSNIQAIPLSTLKKHSKISDRNGDSSGSSAGLYDVLFPERHKGEIIYEPPTKLVTFAGQVYASGGNNSQANSITEPSTSGPNCDDVSGSLEWDYFQQNSPALSTCTESNVELKRIKNICWV